MHPGREPGHNQSTDDDPGALMVFIKLYPTRIPHPKNVLSVRYWARRLLRAPPSCNISLGPCPARYTHIPHLISPSLLTVY